MTPDLSHLSGFARGVLLALHVRDTCLHSGWWLLSAFFFGGMFNIGLQYGGKGQGNSVSIRIAPIISLQAAKSCLFEHPKVSTSFSLCFSV